MRNETTILILIGILALMFFYMGVKYSESRNTEKKLLNLLKSSENANIVSDGDKRLTRIHLYSQTDTIHLQIIIRNE